MNEENSIWTQTTLRTLLAVAGVRHAGVPQGQIRAVPQRKIRGAVFPGRLSGRKTVLRAPRDRDRLGMERLGSKGCSNRGTATQ